MHRLILLVVIAVATGFGLSACSAVSSAAGSNTGMTATENMTSNDTIPTENTSSSENVTVTGQALYEANCFSCHLNPPHAASGALTLVTTKQAYTWWQQVVETMRTNATVEPLATLSESDLDTLIQYLYTQNNK